jgi:hypothetical protein
LDTKSRNLDSSSSSPFTLFPIEAKKTTKKTKMQC